MGRCEQIAEAYVYRSLILLGQSYLTRLIIIGIGAAHQPVVVVLFGYSLKDIARHEIHLRLLLVDVVAYIARPHDAFKSLLIVAKVVEVDEPLAVTCPHALLLLLCRQASAIFSGGQIKSHQGLLGLILLHQEGSSQVYKFLDAHAAHILIAGHGGH